MQDYIMLEKKPDKKTRTSCKEQDTAGIRETLIGEGGYGVKRVQVGVLTVTEGVKQRSTFKKGRGAT